MRVTSEIRFGIKRGRKRDPQNGLNEEEIRIFYGQKVDKKWTKSG